jgi:hypothetical protein
MIPIIGETYEGLYILNEMNSVFMETDYHKYQVRDKATLKLD